MERFFLAILTVAALAALVPRGAIPNRDGTSGTFTWQMERSTASEPSNPMSGHIAALSDSVTRKKVVYAFGRGCDNQQKSYMVYQHKENYTGGGGVRFHDGPANR